MESGGKVVDGCRAEQVRVLLRFLGLEHHAMQLEREEVSAVGWEREARG